MAALNKQAVGYTNTRILGASSDSDFDLAGFDTAETTVNPSITSTQRRPNVPNFAPGTIRVNSASNRSATSLPPSPLNGAGVRSIAATTALPQKNPLRRSSRGPLLAIAMPHPVVALSIVLVVMLFGFVLLSNVVQWWNTWQDDLNYGRPRTFQLDGWVGHNEQTGQPTHFIAQNVDRQISVIEYPGGDPTKARVLLGPHLYGPHDDLVPVKLKLVDVNGDNHVDLIATIGNEQIIYINDNGNFRPMRPDERTTIKVPSGSN